MNKTGAPHGAQLLQHYLDGKNNTPVDFFVDSPVSADVRTTTEFRALDNAIQDLVKQQLDAYPLLADVSLNGPTLPLVAFSSSVLLASHPDLFWAFGGTQGLDVSGSGFRANGYYRGTITYVIRDVYGFSTRSKFLGLGPDLHYLQTYCGLPYYNGPHWFGDSVTVTLPLARRMY
jgi:hypothetical protein